VIWKFAENIEGAKQFLVDYVGNFKQGFSESKFYNFPCFPDTVPDLKQQIAYDPRANPPDKYKVLEDVLDWATNVGYPGSANAAIDEAFRKGAYYEGAQVRCDRILADKVLFKHVVPPTKSVMLVRRRRKETTIDKRRPL
jgi:hypothetical protein